jgi:predicted alpha/beta hydrolase family esterase
MPKVIFIPGNGGGSTEYEWFPWVKTELEKLGCVVISPGTYPDPIVARMDVWLPYIESFGTDENTILIGWSSGALAAMRYAETHKILGTVLVAPCHTDLGLQSEKESGYYDVPWEWDKIKNNQKWIVQFSSTNDPFIPIDEARFVHKQLGSEYYEMDKGHFFPMGEFPELVEAIEKLL